MNIIRVITIVIRGTSISIHLTYCNVKVSVCLILTRLCHISSTTVLAVMKTVRIACHDRKVALIEVSSFFHINVFFGGDFFLIQIEARGCCMLQTVKTF